MNTKLIDSLSVVLANNYALYLKTQNYHWHVVGPRFHSLHEMFEQQYQNLQEANDEIAERIRALGAYAPATFAEYAKLMQIKEGNSKADANTMVKTLRDDNQKLVDLCYKALHIAEEVGDHATADFMSDRILDHQKFHWMLTVSVE